MPPAQGLAVLERADTAGGLVVRVALDEGELVARAVDGGVRVDGHALENELAPVGGEPHAWRGFPRTVQVELTGNGTVMLADDASGVVLRVSQRGRPSEPESGAPVEPDVSADARRAPPDGPAAPGSAAGPPASPAPYAAPTAPASPPDPETGGQAMRVALLIAALLVAGLAAMHVARGRRVR